MKHNDMRNKNALNIFNLVIHKGLSIDELTNKTGLSHVTVRNIGNLLCSRKYLQSYTVISHQLGRRAEHFALSRKCYSVYMHEEEYTYMIIGLNPFFDIMFRHDYIKKKRYTYEENLIEAIKTVTTRPDYIHCINFFANGTEQCISNLPDFIKGVRLKTFITENVAPSENSVIIEFPDECYLSIHGEIYKNKVSKNEILKVIPNARLITYRKNILFGLYNGLRQSSIITIQRKILEM